MSDVDVTSPKHYQHYPICGFCMAVWDMIYLRTRLAGNPTEHLNLCKWGGCDPDIWDYLDEKTGFPLGWRVKNGVVKWDRDKLRKHMPPYDNRVYHKRRDNSGTAPWRHNSSRLSKAFEQPGSNGKKDKEEPPPKVTKGKKVTAPVVVEDDDDEDIW